MLSAEDLAHLDRCLELAERGRRTAAPNPVVGAVVVREGRVLGEGWHVRPGGDHAEVSALRAAGDANGATLYVSLEPCCHHGRTPPCTEAIVAAGVQRVVAAAIDPTDRVNGQGVERLRQAGVTVDVAEGEIERRARRQNAPWRTRSLLGRPHVTYKAAASLDGRTATVSGESHWISSAASRRLVHEMRAGCGAVAVGIGTVLRDDPYLTARDVDPPPERQPLRVVFDRRGRLPEDCRLAVTAAKAPVLVVVAPGTAPLPLPGVETLPAASLGDALRELAGREIDSLLLEGGATLAGSFLADGLIDRICLFTAPRLLGGGPGLFAGWAADSLETAPTPVDVTAGPVGPDILLTAELREP
ncbi:MAG: bifunctional diaminohydroxyphosphoribosylaminopyrimidine deaminase/5-amino-6-(5-phosphoribosylamino)uracil reductase RibD [Gaiellales bacterium]